MRGGITMAEVKTDCFGFDKRFCSCKIMTEPICKKRRCSFYKTMEQFKADIEKYSFKNASGGDCYEKI